MDGYEFKHPDNRHLTCPNYGKPTQYKHKPLQELTRPHVDSFNYMLLRGLNKAAQSIYVPELDLPNGDRISFFFKDVSISKPTITEGNKFALDHRLLPRECRERGITYSGGIKVRVGWQVNGVNQPTIERHVGQIPIMVKSLVCHLDEMDPTQLVRHGEEADELGGYFIINGIERVIRMLINPRRNYPLATTRPSWKNRGRNYTEYGISLRSVREDESAANTVLHYLSDGTVRMSIAHHRQIFYVPIMLVLRALVPQSDQFIKDRLMVGSEEDSFYRGCILSMLRAVHDDGVHTRRQALDYLGKHFRVKVNTPAWYTDAQVTQFLFRHCVCIHLDEEREKFNLLAYMTQKLFMFARGKCAGESSDSAMFQEVLLPGHLYQIVLKEKLENWLSSIRSYIEKLSKDDKKQGGLNFRCSPAVLADSFRKVPDLTRPMDYFLSTGNLVSKSGLGLMQSTGLTVVADKLNFCRYLSHFRCIHRGAFFAEMRTTAVRKLLPESWGFLCPVHTPDGAPCGLMNHMTFMCQIVNESFERSKDLLLLLVSLGMEPYSSSILNSSKRESYVVMLDGRLAGWVAESEATGFIAQLRHLKISHTLEVPPFTEITLVPRTKASSQYPGIYLFTSQARLVRPVRNLATSGAELIGTFEQAYLHICVTPEEYVDGITTHMEIYPFSILSEMASFTPFSDFNQSPRNMYQCQMGKQTMGVPLHAWKHRSDNKLYRLHTAQSPMVRTALYDYYNMDSYPLGTNAVVAVLSYTGYDMEDAMVINKASLDRGFANGSVIKSQFIDLKEVSGEKFCNSLVFATDPLDTKTSEKLDPDGLPPVGRLLEDGEPFYSYLDMQTSKYKVQTYKSYEAAYVDNIKLLGSDLGQTSLTKVCIVLRIPRNPIIGDKMSSRHGQKGILSQKWPTENMPFSESGIIPDILFNPHGFPSRMTIGMMLEFMSGKSAAMHGICHDATPFVFSENDTAIDYFGDLLRKAGYKYTGEETMYSGITGLPFTVSIFTGIVYYQRLRHMVSDKYQVRTTGPLDAVTMQPVQGRKRGGGIRLGEMERDALIAHGTAFLLHDRLFNCSDGTTAQVCKQCGSLVSPLLERLTSSAGDSQQSWTCVICKSTDAKSSEPTDSERKHDPSTRVGGSGSIVTIRVPHVFKYLVAELAAMNVATVLDVRQH